MLRWLATLVILALLALDLALPITAIGRRGHDAVGKADVEGAWARVGAPLPDLALETLSGASLSLADFRGHPLIVTFERSVDW